MPFTVSDFQDLVRLLEQHPEWRVELRRLLLTDEILALPEIVRRLAEAQERVEVQLAELVEAQRQAAEAQRLTDQRLAELAEAQRRTEERLERLEATVTQLIEAQRHTEERLQRLEATVAQLIEAQRLTDQRLAELAEAQRRTEERLERLEATVTQLIEAQRHTEERLQRLEATVAQLIEAQRLTDQRLAELAEAQRRTEERLERLEATVTQLIEAQRHTEERLQRLEATVAQLAEAQQRTEERLQRLIDTVGEMRGSLLEYRYRERVAAYFGPYLRRVRAVPLQELEDSLEQQLSPEELTELFQLDLLVRGMPRHLPEAPEVWLAIEASAVVDAGDVARARRRAALLSRAGYPAVPVAAGEGATQGAQEEAQAHRVVLLQDGHTLYWSEALAAWLRLPETSG